MEQYDHGGDVYGSDRPVLDFSISLNPNGPPRKVLEAAREAVLDWDRYPDPQCRGLKRAAARRYGVPEEALLRVAEGAEESGVRRENRKLYIDKIAAVFILQGYLDSVGMRGV